MKIDSFMIWIDDEKLAKHKIEIFNYKFIHTLYES